MDDGDDDDTDDDTDDTDYDDDTGDDTDDDTDDHDDEDDDDDHKSDSYTAAGVPSVLLALAFLVPTSGFRSGFQLPASGPVRSSLASSLVWLLSSGFWSGRVWSSLPYKVTYDKLRSSKDHLH